MKVVELYGRVRFAVQREGLSNREAARRFGIDPRTVAKMLLFSVPPGYRRRQPPKRPKLDLFIGAIERILEDDKGRPANVIPRGGFSNACATSTGMPAGSPL
jgi:hypothetical protein